MPDAPYLINGLRLTGFDTKEDSFDKVRADFEALQGDAGFTVSKLSGDTVEAIYEHNAETGFAVGSTFKLYVLSELARQVQTGSRKWSDVVTIDRKSFPSGISQNWPDGAPATLQTLATLMISISDNTATDVLIHVLGRDNVGALLTATGHSNPDRTLPFLTSVEAFALKDKDQKDLLERFVTGSEEEQAVMLKEAAGRLSLDNVNLTDLAGETPRHIDTVEWFVSPNDTAKLFSYIIKQGDKTALDVMAVNDGLPEGNKKDWEYIGFKGGSEPGVVSLNYLMKNKAGDWYVVAGSWNDTAKAVDTQTLVLLMSRLVSLAAK